MIYEVPPMEPMNFKSRWVMITGASAGLGRELALQLGRDYGANIVAVARREDRLNALRDELKEMGSEVLPLAAELSQVDEVDRVYEEATRRVDLYGAILNAGVTHFGDWHELSWEAFQQMLNVNVVSVVRLTNLLLPYMQKQDQGGGLLLVSSMAGLAPVPYQAAYSGTKAFLVHYGCSLFHEARGKNVSVTTFAPGGIATDMTAGARFDSLRTWLMPVDRCAKSAIEGYRRRKYLHVPGVVYKVLAALNNVAPEPFSTGRVAAQYRASLNAAKNGQ